MPEFLRRNIIIISIIVIVTVAAVFLVWLVIRSSAPTTTPQPVSDIPAEVVASNTELTEEERKAAIYALDFLYSYGNYEAPNSFFVNLDGNVTDNFKPRVEQLRQLVEEPGSDLYSNLIPGKDNYTISITQLSSSTIAEATFNAVLSNNQVKEKPVVVKVRMVKENNYWLLDNVHIQ